MKKTLIILLSLILLLTGCTGLKEGDEDKPSPTPIQSESSATPQATAEHQSSTSNFKDRIYGSDDVGMYNYIAEADDYRVFNVSLEVEPEDEYSDAASFEIKFLLPEGWYCLKEPFATELYLGATEGINCKLFDSRIWIYDNTDICMGAIGIKRSKISSDERIDSAEELQKFYAGINSGNDYRFTTKEYYFPTAKSIMQFENHFEANAITEVLYTKEYLKSFGKNSKNDRLNMGILSKRPDDNVYVCMEFFSGRLNSVELMDIARSVVWSGAEASVIRKDTGSAD